MNALALVLLLAPGYHGTKYEGDPRLDAVLRELPELEAAARERVRSAAGAVPRRVELRVEDAGDRRDGLRAETRTEGGRQRVVLFAEYLVLDAHDVRATLAHELFHCLQRESLGERYRDVPEWAREGAALYVARQTDRLDDLVVLAGTDPRLEDPLARLANGLRSTPHTLWDYGEDLCAFLAAEQRHGKERMGALLRALLAAPDPRRAVREALGEDFETFARRAEAHARWRLAVPAATRALLLGAADLEPAAALERLAEDHGAFRAEALRARAAIQFAQGRGDDALRSVRAAVLARTPRLGEALLLELRILEGTPGFVAAHRRALLDLEPFTVYEQVRKLGGG